MENRMTEVFTSHFHILYWEEDRDFAEKLRSQIGAFYEKMCEKACIDAGEEVYDLYVCGTVEDFIRFTGKDREDYQDWMVGNTDIHRKRLCILAPRAKGDFSEGYERYLIKVMLHEVVHLVFDRICAPEDCAIWLAEGTALYYAGQTVSSYVSETEYPRIADLGGTEDGMAFAENGGYDYAGIYVWYLMEKCGMEKFLSFYRGECGLEELQDEAFEHQAIISYKKSLSGE